MAEARRIVAEAQAEALQLRAEAWAGAEGLLRQAEVAHRARIAEADAEVLVIRAEAEQEAYRLVSTAKREAQDITRGARFEAERTVLEIWAQPERILPVDPQPVEPAPAPAPESIGGRLRRRRNAAGPAPAAEDVIRVIQPPGARRPSGGVDPASYGDALAAEVEALRESGEVEVPEIAPPPVPVAEAPPPAAAVPPEPPAPAPIAPVVPAAAVLEAQVEWAEATPAEARLEEAEGTEKGLVGPAAEELAEEAGEGVAIAEEAVQPPPAPAAPAPASKEAPAAPIDDLFARLRGSVPARRPAAVAEGEDGSPGEEAEPAAPSGPGRAAPRPDPLDLRERLLLPVQNRALRRVKEAIVELQNVALDALRVTGAWEGAASGPPLEAALDPVAEEGAEAGAAAAGVFLGGEAPAPVISARCVSLAQAMAGDLAAQVQAVVAGSAGAGSLEVSAAVARVFRAWRSDEAERWVRAVAYAAYHDSLLSGLAVAGVARVAPVASGLLCPECPALGGAGWDPAGSPPPGTARPPAHPGCVCTVAPV